jgi:hypothetical protein
MALVVVAAYKKDLVNVPDVASCSGDCVAAVDKMWRILIAFGGVPGWFALYYRLTIPETPRYTFDVLYDVEKASMDTRRYRYGKSGNTMNPIEQAQVRRDMVSEAQSYKRVCSWSRSCVSLISAMQLCGLKVSFVWNHSLMTLHRPSTRPRVQRLGRYTATIARNATS